MPELDDMQNDDLMNAVFADVRQEVAGYIRPAGAAAAVATVKRRRRNRTIAGAALAVALIAGPAIGLAWAQNRPDGSPDVADPTPSVSASESAPASPSAGPSGSGSPSVLDPGIPMSQLKNSTLTVPSWPGSVNEGCQSGPLKFTDGKNVRSGGSAVEVRLAGDPVYTDVNADGRNETVIRVDCTLQGLFTQVLAFSRSADGKVSLLGKVVGTHIEGSDVQKVWEIRADAPGRIRVEVGDVSPCCGTPAELPQHQWRVYGWDGQKFHQTGGQTTFPVNPKTTDLTVSSTPLHGVSTDGVTWVGSMVVTATNRGPHAANRLELTFSFPVEVKLKSNQGGTCATEQAPSTHFACRFDKLASGASAQISFTVTWSGQQAGKPGTAVYVHNGSTEGESYPDVNQNNNKADVQIT